MYGPKILHYLLKFGKSTKWIIKKNKKISTESVKKAKKKFGHKIDKNINLKILTIYLSNKIVATKKPDKLLWINIRILLHLMKITELLID